MNTQPESLRLAHVSDPPIPPDWSDMVAAVRELLQLHAENEALQQVYDARQLEIDHLRGVTKSKLLAQPVAWMVYLPSIDTQHLYYSQEDMGYVDDVTNHADAEVTPLYEMAAPKAEVAPAGEYPAITTEFINKHVHPSQAAKLCCADWSGKDESSVETVHPEVIKLLHAYVDADRAMRAQAAPVAHGDAQQRAMDARHAAIYRWIIQHIDKAASIIDAWREDGEADKDELHDALAARAANAIGQRGAACGASAAPTGCASNGSETEE